ncbi:hypothetical protein P3L10_013375 [Capsicum annuum]
MEFSIQCCRSFLTGGEVRYVQVSLTIESIIECYQKILAGNIEDLIPPSERYIFYFSSKDELKNWHLYSDSEYGGLSSAALEIKDTGNGSASVVISSPLSSLSAPPGPALPLLL